MGGAAKKVVLTHLVKSVEKKRVGVAAMGERESGRPLGKEVWATKEQ